MFIRTNSHHILIAVLLVLVFSGSLTLFASFSSLPSSYAQRIGNAEVLLSEIYIEPADPKPGDQVSIQSIVYNAGLESTKSVTDVVTVGYFVNGDLLRIAELPNIEPGVKNGVLISSGPIFTASDGSHKITVILNYHDTLSHLTDNPANNIVQRMFSIGDPRPSVVLFEIFQEYDPHTKMQRITIDGNLSSSEMKFLPSQVRLDLGSFRDVIPVDQDGLFSFSKSILSFDDVTPVIITVEENYPLLESSYTANIYPVHLESDSIMSFQIQNPSESYNFKDSSAVIVIYDESYNEIRKIDVESILPSERYHDIVLVTVPSGTYIAEVYLEGRFIHAVKTHLKENMISTSSILISETSKVQFQISDADGGPASDATVFGESFTLITDENGFTDWVNVLPAIDGQEPYHVTAILSNGKIISAEPFFVGYGEQKTVQVTER